MTLFLLLLLSFFLVLPDVVVGNSTQPPDAEREVVTLNHSDVFWASRLSLPSDASRSAELLHSVRRSTPRGKQAPNSALSQDSGPYFEGFISILIVSFMIGLSVLGCGVCFCGCRFCCDRFGNHHDDDDGRPYSKAQIWIPKGCVVCFAVLLVVVSAVIVYGNQLIASDLTAFGDSIVVGGANESARADALFDDVRRIDLRPKPYNCTAPVSGCEPCPVDGPCDQSLCECTGCYGTCNMTLNPNFAHDDGFMEDFKKEGLAVADAATNARDHFTSLNLWRLSFLGVGIALMAVMIIVACVAVICNVAMAAVAAGALSFLVMAFYWFNAGLAFATSVAMADACLWFEDPLIERGPDALVADQMLLDQANTNFQIGNFLKTMAAREGGPTEAFRQLVIIIFDDDNRVDYRLNGPTSGAERDVFDQDDQDLLLAIKTLDDMRLGSWILNLFAEFQPVTCKLDGSVYIWASLFVCFLFTIPITISTIILFRRLQERDDDDDAFYLT